MNMQRVADNQLIVVLTCDNDHTETHILTIEPHQTVGECINWIFSTYERVKSLTFSDCYHSFVRIEYRQKIED